MVMSYADNKGVKVYYESWGSGGVPIVFLHPWSTNGYIWYFQLYHFARNNTCVVVAHRGHGRSDKPASGYSIQEHASDVAAVMDAAKIDKAVIVGNSIGGMMAMQLCLARPERVLGLVIQSSGTALAEGLPKEVMEAMIRDRDGTFNQLLEGTVSARTKRERPEILDLARASFMLESNWPHHVFDSAIKDPNGVFQQVIAQVVEAERVGFSNFWSVEHHFLSEFAYSSAPEVLYGALSQRTSKIRIGHGVRLLPFPYNHPIRVAEMGATVDLLCDGRMEFGTGRSVSRDELEGFGINPSETRALWEEALDVVVGAWTNEVFSWEGKYFKIPPREILPKPLQKPPPPLWCASTGPEPHEIAGRKGLGLLS